MADTHDLGLELPLHGVNLVEASAGTGKTFVLATLYARAVIEARLPVDALLAVTFTVAATDELRTRIRERLTLALRLVDGEPVDASPARQSTRALVDAALADGEPVAALRRRLREAAEAMDLAPVFTIHGFCQRALADHAFDAGRPPGDVALVANERALREEVATDLWRAVCTDAEDARLLAALWPSPAKLAGGLADLWAVEALRPEPPAIDADAERAARVACRAATDALRTACDRLGDDTIAAMRAAIATGGISRSTHRSERVDRLHGALVAWVADACAGEAPKDIDVLGSGRLADAVKKPYAGKVSMPRNALTDAIDAWLAADAALAAFAAPRRVALMHRLRDEGRARFVALKKQRQLQGFDDLVRDVADALAGPGGEALAARLREQYRFAFVDEFQDTDPRQWAIFRRVFAEAPDDGAPRALYLIGDPKQAIYRFRGGDVHTYLEARERADSAKSLYVNFRSRPRALEAVQALYAGAGLAPFGPGDVGFEPMKAGGQVADAAFAVDGAPAPALEILTWDDSAGSPDAGTACDRAALAAAARIRELLASGATIDGAAVAPKDIAVLVASHRQGRRMQQELARVGVPSVAAGRDSLFRTDEATDLLALLDAALHLADDARLRAALATPLIGLGALEIAALDTDGDTHRRWQERALRWRQRWERHGPLALVTDLCADAAARLLGQHGGERRLANWLQLGEALQAATAGRDVVDGVRVLADLIAHADEGNDEELLRLESDAARVKVLTLHASKGLEFPLVFLPFLSHAGRDPTRGAKFARHHRRGTGRVGVVDDGDAAAFDEACRLDREEEAAEQARLLYVGLTRARLATVVGFGMLRDVGRSAFARLLFGGAVEKPDAATLHAKLVAVAASAPDAIVLRPAATQRPPGLAALPATAPPPAAAVAARTLSRDWSVHSFSALTREAGGSDARGAADEHDPPGAPDRFSGARFGNVLHDALEHVDFAAWRDWTGAAPPPGQVEPIERALRGGGYTSAADLDAGVPRVAALVRDTLNVVLPEGVRLADVPPSARIAELEFHFDLAPADVPALLASLHAHGLVAGRRGFGLRARLEGLLTGFIDLIYEHAGRVYVLDYKSNRLPAYDDAALADAMAHGEYDLQYLLYVLALHRWLRFRKADYDYDRDVGGVRYLFCRGLDSGGGVVATKPPRALVEALDALLGRAGVAA